MRAQKRVLGLVLFSLLCGCGGGGGGGDGSESDSVTIDAPNEVAVVVDGGPTGIAINLPFTTVTVCAPGTSNCKTIDHVLIDTGSVGLRIMASLLDPLTLPAVTDGSRAPIVECTQFADGYAWGPTRLADVQIAEERAAAIPIQVIGDSNAPAVPDDCSQSAGTELDTVAAFGANGVLGVGVFAEDCGLTCNLQPSSSSYTHFYYACPEGTSCSSTPMPLAQQTQNPVSHFPVDNNGIILELSAFTGVATANLRGKLVFGIGTQNNNALGSRHILSVDSQRGTVVTTFNGAPAITESYVDSGSNLMFFVDPRTETCDGRNDVANGLYCPASSQALTATIQQNDGSQTTVHFTVDNAHTVLTAHPTATAFATLAAPGFGSLEGDTFVWGLPFFFGRDIYVAIEGQSVSAPYIAF